MRSVLGLLPFLAVPFLAGGVTSSGRMLALVGLGFMACRWIVDRYYLNPSEEIPSIFSPFHPVLMLGGILFYFTIDDFWYRYATWPGLALGILFATALAGQPSRVLPGLVLACALLWLVTVGMAPSSGFYPLDRFPSLVSRAYPLDPANPESTLPFHQAILAPVSGAPAQLTLLTLILTTTLLFVFAFSKRGREAQGFQWVILGAWSLAIHPWLGNGVFALLGIHFLFFIFLTDWPDALTPKAKQAWAAGILVLGAAGSLGWLNPLLSWITPYFSFLDRLLPESVTLKVLGNIQPGTLFSGGGWFSHGGLFPFILAAGVLFLFAESALERERDDLLLPAGLSLLLMGLLSVLPSWKAAFMHPLTWLATVCAQNAYRRPALRPGETGQSLAILWIPGASAGLSAFLLLMGFWTVYPEWSAERALNRFATQVRSTDLLETAQSAFQTAPYRGDLAAIHATAVTHSMVLEGTLPSQADEDRLHYALQAAERYGYIPYLAIKRLSDFYIMKNDKERSLDVLRTAVDQFPGQLPLQAMLAERLAALGKTDQAIRAYQTCVNLNPSETRYRIQLARLYQSQGKIEEAKQEWNRIQTLDPTQSIPRL